MNVLLSILRCPILPKLPVYNRAMSDGLLTSSLRRSSSWVSLERKLSLRVVSWSESCNNVINEYHYMLYQLHLHAPRLHTYCIEMEQWYKKDKSIIQNYYYTTMTIHNYVPLICLLDGQEAITSTYSFLVETILTE